MIASVAMVGSVVAGIVFSAPELMQKVQRQPVVVQLLPLPVEPPPAERQQPRHSPQQQRSHEQPRVQPEVAEPAPLVPVAAPRETPPPSAPPEMARPERPGKALAQQPAPGPVNGGDLSSRMLSANPPRYPLESRRLREEGTVVLDVLLSVEGRVAQISVSQSSGFFRLDKAAVHAVRHWRWSPLVRDGAPVMVRGLVTIPFVLQA